MKRILCLLVLASSAVLIAAEPFYTTPQLFTLRPSATASKQSVAAFGPVGISIELHQPAFVMKVGSVEEGSPAQAAGLEPGWIIESINGQKLADIDPRIQLGSIITAAEAGDGVVAFRVKDKADAAAREIVVKIPVLGAYSPTWPLNCKKSDRIVRALADHYGSKEFSGSGLNGAEMLFLLSTGEDKDLAVVRRWVKELVKDTRQPNYAWHIGYGGVPLAEYYLRTGDAEVLPLIERHVAGAKEIYHLGGWAGRTYGSLKYGHMNAAGSHVVSFLLLAKECGLSGHEGVMLQSLEQQFRYAGRGLNPYGDGHPEKGFIDNGKTGVLAFTMAAATSLDPDGENTLYARARDICAAKAFFSTSFLCKGHTGGGIGEVWRGGSIGFLPGIRPRQYRDLVEQRRWWYEMSRRHDGSFTLLNGGGYERKSWVTPIIGLAYTAPRKTLQITGAPNTKWCKSFELPARIWGTAADDAFLSVEAPARPDGTRADMDAERFETASSYPALTRMGVQRNRWSHEIPPPKTKPTHDTYRDYIHHAEMGLREFVSDRIAGDKVLILECLQHDDARVRDVGVRAIRGGGHLSPEILAHLGTMLEDPEESWWVVEGVLKAMSHAPGESIGKHLDRIIHFAKHRDWWLQHAGLQALVQVATAPEHYRKALPVIRDVTASNHRSKTLGPLGGLANKLRAADPTIRNAGLKLLIDAYTAFPAENPTRKDKPHPTTESWHLERIASTIAPVQGGLDALYEVAKQRNPGEPLPHRAVFLGTSNYDENPNTKKNLGPLILDGLVPEFIGKNRTRLLDNLENTRQTTYPCADPLDQLADLYRKVGNHDYDWRVFADLRQREWWYHSFDPPAAEQVPFDQLITRYRDVTFPAGMENWFAADFDPAAAGWKRGHSPFGNLNGKIPPAKGAPTKYFKGEPVKTLWENEVLLFRDTVKIPPLKPGHRYRLRVNNGEAVGTGGGFQVFVNGTSFAEKTQGNGRGSGGKAKGGFVTEEWLPEFAKGELTIAVKTFIRYNDKYKTKPGSKTPMGEISVHLDEMKLPTVGEAEIIKSAAAAPMLNREWQNSREDSDKFLWSGTFEPRPERLGTWQAVSEVATIEEFDAVNPMRARRPILASVTFKEAARTHHPMWIWSGDMLMDLSKNQALAIIPKRIAGETYLFVENGGFSNRNKEDWKPMFMVLKKSE